MADILIIATRGVEDPTRAGLGFLLAKGAVEEGHQVSIVLVGDGSLLMKPALRESVTPLGLPPLKELFQFSVDHKVPMYVGGLCGKARGVSDEDLQTGNASWIDPKRLATLVAEHDRNVTF